VPNNLELIQRDLPVSKPLHAHVLLVYRFR
jgi:hypothetical protein